MSIVDVLENGKMGKTLGRGEFGCVKLIKSGRKEYALKCQTTKDFGQFYASVREEFCTFIKHPNIIFCFDSLWHNFNWYGLYEVGVPLCPHDQHHKVLWDIAKGLACLHAHGVVHRDITPNNIVRVGESYKIIDFGLARPLTKTSDTQSEGMVSLFWRPIEILEGGNTDARCDIWSLGVVCLSLLRGYKLFDGTCDNIISQFKALQFSFEEGVYSKMVCGLDKRWNSFQLCDDLCLEYSTETSVPLVSAVHRDALLGRDVDIDMYNKNGF